MGYIWIYTELKEKPLLLPAPPPAWGCCSARSWCGAAPMPVLADIDPEAAEKAAQAINAESRNGGRAISAACDVRRYDEVCAVRDLAVSTFGCIDILVTLAGGAEMRMCHAEGEFPDVPIEVYDWVWMST